MKYLNTQNCRRLANASGKQLSKDALYALNNMVYEAIEKACNVHNGGAKRIDATVMNFVKPKK